MSIAAADAAAASPHNLNAVALQLLLGACSGGPVGHNKPLSKIKFVANSKSMPMPFLSRSSPCKKAAQGVGRYQTRSVSSNRYSMCKAPYLKKGFEAAKSLIVPHAVRSRSMSISHYPVY